jgi:hypothetical protein
MQATPVATQKPILVRSYGRKIDGQWVGVCLNFGLAAQADTFDELCHKLHEQIRDYISEAFGQDSAHRDYLLSRRAPLRDYLVYAWIDLKITLAHLWHSMSRERIRIMRERIPLPC